MIIIMMMIIIIYVFTHSHVLCTVDRNCPEYISSIIFGHQQFYMICSGPFIFFWSTHLGPVTSCNWILCPPGTTSWKVLCIHLEAAGRAKKASFTDKCPTISLDAAHLGWLPTRLVRNADINAAPNIANTPWPWRFIGPSEVPISSSYYTNWIWCSI